MLNRWKIICLFTGVFILIGTVYTFGQLLSFPCAEGFGAKSIGGRGGKIIFVTNTNDAGNGSLRAACEASGARTVVFKVSGLISLKSIINISNPFITVAGQTAPGDGICLRGGQLSVSTHDVIIRYIRSRAGDNTGFDSGINPDNRDCFEIQNESSPPYNVIFDHCSATWGIDETMSTWYPCKDITFQWCLIGEGLHNSLHTKGPHGKGLLIGDGARNISVHHNLFAYNFDRNPMIKGSTTTEICNNVIAGWGSDDYNAVYIGLLVNEGHTPLQPTYSNMIGNTFIPIGISFSTWSIRANGNMEVNSKLYIRDNIGPGRLSNSDPDLNILRSRDVSFASSTSTVSNSTLTISSSHKAWNDVMAGAGANYPKRDVVDTRIINNVKNNIGNIINSQSEVGGYPAYNSSISPADTDEDGIPDVWETVNKLNPNNAADGNSTAPSGYTRVEDYINSLVKCEGTTLEVGKGQQTSIFEVFPNPAHHLLHVKYAPLGFSVILQDLQGKKVLERYTDNELTILDISMLKAGLYTLKIGNVISKIAIN